MARRDARVTAYIAGRPPFARPVLRKLRTMLLAAHPGLEETIKWGMPTYVHEGRIVCGYAGFTKHCALWFWQGKAIVGKKPAEAMGNFGRLTSVGELPSATQLKRFVREGVALREGKKVAGRKRR